MRRALIILYKVLFLWLLVQFFAQTLVTYGVGFNPDRLQYIWLRKEWLIALLGLIWAIWVVATWKRRVLLRNEWIVSIIALIGALILVTYLIHIQLLEGARGSYILAFKYDIFGFCILVISLLGATLLEQDERSRLLHRYVGMMKIVLLLAVARYLIVFIKPGTLKLFGYNPMIFEWVVESAPPAAYFTQINAGLPRNTFLFERPTTFGFWLIAFWPLFYLIALRKEPLKYTWLRWGVYGLNIVLTFSRAARGARLILLILLPILLSGKIKNSLIKYWLPALILFACIAYLGFDTIIDRGYSNYGHVTMLNIWRDLFTSSPLVWLWWATAWPWSHRNGIVFNPENQFLQLLIEFGLTWWGIWIRLFGLLCVRWVVDYRKRWVFSPLLAVSLGMIGLAISWMVLHSFVDRMVVYPFMLVYGIAGVTTLFPNICDDTTQWPQEQLTPPTDQDLIT